MRKKVYNEILLFIQKLEYFKGSAIKTMKKLMVTISERK